MLLSRPAALQCAPSSMSLTAADEQHTYLIASTRAAFFSSSTSSFFLLQQACELLRAGQALSYRRLVIPKPDHGHAMFIRLPERARPSAPPDQRGV